MYICYTRHDSWGILLCFSGWSNGLQEPLCMTDIPTPNISVTPMLPTSDSGNTECIITRDEMEYILLPTTEKGNLTYQCVTSTSTLLWQIGGCDSDDLGYQLVDRDEFALNGVHVQDSTGSSFFRLYDEGRDFITQQLRSRWFTVECVAIVDDLNVYRSNTFIVELYGMYVCVGGVE